MFIINVTSLYYRHKPWGEIVYRGLQFVAMLIIMQLPGMLKLHFQVEVPWTLSVVIVVFCFLALVMGDGLDLYGRLPWWDKLLHAVSGELKPLRSCIATIFMC